MRGGRVMVVLSAAEQADLAVRFQAGDREALDRLVESSQGIVRSYSWSYAKTTPHVSVDDLKQESNLVLIAAARKFDPSRGWAWNTYAGTAIRRALLNHVQGFRPLSGADQEFLEEQEERPCNSPDDRVDPALLDSLPGNERALIAAYLECGELRRAAKSAGVSVEQAESLFDSACDRIRNSSRPAARRPR